MDLAKLCRLCFSESVIKGSLFDLNDSKGISFSSKILLCTSLMASPGDGFSELICQDCYDMVYLFSEFRKTCMDTHIYMYNALQTFSDPLLVQQIEVTNSVKEKMSRIRKNAKCIQNSCLDEEILKPNEIERQQTEKQNGVQEVNESASDHSYMKIDSFEELFPIPDFPELSVLEETQPHLEPEENVIVDPQTYQFDADLILVPEDPILRHICEKCGYKFSSIDALWAHIESFHVNVGPYKCNRCPKTYCDKFELENHQRSHEDAVDCFCYVCKKRFSRKSNLRLHLKTHKEVSPESFSGSEQNPGKYSCENCGERCTSIKNLRRHIQSAHEGYRPYHCDKCTKAFYDQYELKYHQRLHQDVENFCCSFCGKRVSRKSGLRAHMKNVHGDILPDVIEKTLQDPNKAALKYSCDNCSEQFNSLRNLRLHISSSHSNYRPFQCNKCPRAFYDKYELKYHQRLHEDVVNFCCSFCGKRFARKSGLRVHMRIHTGEKPFYCNVCGTSFAHKNSLDAHQRLHTGEKPFSCKFCTRMFAQSSTAKAHEEIHLGGQKLQQCDVCDRMFATEEELACHFSSHEDETYRCQVCFRGFKQVSILKKHTQRYHSEERPFPCGECSKSYVTAYELKKHRDTHRGVLPFICMFCNKSYKVKTTLSRHINKHHFSDIISQIVDRTGELS